MAKLIITRGYPGSGKTTWAKALTGFIRVNRDDLRQSLFGKPAPLTADEESAVTKAQRAQVKALLEAGVNVVVDDTNLNLRYAKDLADIAARAEAEFECVDFRISADQCAVRDQQRILAGERGVGSDVILKMAQRYPLKSWQPVVARVAPKPVFEKWEAVAGLPSAVLTDIDGTLANHQGVRNPYDFSKVLRDRPILHTIDAVRAIASQHRVPIIALSGRDDSCRDATLTWMRLCGIEPADLLMRKTGDKRRDDIVKNEIFQNEIRPFYNPLAVFDDRLSVCRMWHQIGVPLFRVGDPDANF